MGLPGVPEMILILAAILLLFGASKLPKLGGAIGESIKNFKKGIRDEEEPRIADKDKSDADSSGKSS